VQVAATPPLNISLGKSPKYIRSMSISVTVDEVRKIVDDFATLVPSCS
jgi:hypothetical protein